MRVIIPLAASALVLAALTACQSDHTPEDSKAPAPPVTTSKATPTSADAGVLPDLRGDLIREAQAAVEAAGFGTVTYHDSLGRDRLHALTRDTRDWQVCFQTPAPGKHDVQETVDIGAVAFGEACPAEDEGAPTAVDSPMPNLVGRNADIARMALRAADSVSIVDVTTGRPALPYSAYKVCSQSPEPGAEMSGQPVTLKAIGTDEDCP